MPISKTRLKITFLEWRSDLPGANELMEEVVESAIPAFSVVRVLEGGMPGVKQDFWVSGDTNIAY